MAMKRKDLVLWIKNVVLAAFGIWPLEFVGKDNVSLIIVITIVWIQKSFIFLLF